MIFCVVLVAFEDNSFFLFGGVSIFIHASCDFDMFLNIGLILLICICFDLDFVDVLACDPLF